MPTLEDPDEVWLALYKKGRKYSYRNRYLKVFAGKDAKFVLVAREDPDGSLMWTFFKTRSWRYVDKQRVGALLYRREG